MTAANGSLRASPALPVVAMVVGAASVILWLVPGATGMIAVGVTGTLAVVLGTIALLASDKGPSRRARIAGIAAVILGLLGLAGVWVTAVLVASIPG